MIFILRIKLFTYLMLINSLYNITHLAKVSYVHQYKFNKTWR